MENIALQRLQVFFIIVLRAEIATTSQSYIFRILQDFATKSWNFTTFQRFFPGIWFFCLFGFV